MIPRINSKGASFKGLAAYLLHDKDQAKTSERVEWVETVNIATRNPDAAWRVMALTALDAARLKEQAGVKRTGRGSKDAVLHLSLAWAPNQKPDRRQMSELARRALAALKAEDRQAMIICHKDAKHPHVHIMINRVSPTDGRMLSSSNEKLALSELALAYERECGAVLCQERAQNAAKRAKGEYVRGKDPSRREWEAKRDAKLEAEKEVSAQLQKQDPQAAADLRAAVATRLAARLDAAQQQVRAQWRTLYQRQRQEAAQGQLQKSSVLDRLRGWIKGKDKAASPALPFQRQSLKSLAVDGKARAAQQRAERNALSRSSKAGIRQMFGEIRAVCQAAVREIFRRPDQGGLSPQFGPAASQAGISPAPAQTPPPRRRTALADKFREQQDRQPEPKPLAPSRQKDRDRDYER